MNNIHHPVVAPLIDAAAIRTYCKLVFGYLSGRVAVRLISEKGTPEQPPLSHGCKVEDLAELLIRIAPGAAAAQRAVFVVPVSLKPGTRATAKDILEIGTVIADVDKGDIAAVTAHLILHLGTPSMEVCSGGLTEEGQQKRHLYWKFSEAAVGEEIDLITRLRCDIARKVGADTSFDRITQPIRVAGTIHGKYGVQAPVQIAAQSSAEYHLAEFAEAVAAMPAMAGGMIIDTGMIQSKGPTFADLTTMTVRADGLDEITRFDALSKVIGHWLSVARSGSVSLAEAWRTVEAHNAAMISPPWPEDRLLREFKALLKRDIAAKGPMPADAAGEDTTGSAPALSEDALAQTFVRQFGSDWHHVPAWGKWYRWTGLQWQRDDTGTTFQAVRLVCRAEAGKIEVVREARKITNAKTYLAVQKIAGHDPDIALETEAFDQHPFKLNTPSGVVDLDTGVVEPHDRSLLLTQMTRVGPGKGCPNWLHFLQVATNGDTALQAYLARVAGYCLTGSMREQVFFFLHGSGANGKSVFLQTLSWILGDYAATVVSGLNRATAKELFASWSAWAKPNGFDPRSTRYLGEQLRGRGFTSGKVGQDRGWIGLALRRGPQAGDEV